ncbi:MAG: hypothetical protein HYS23_16115 [Geobacter sp.]|nr:hypothetical protein [Geobacter sp.]
MSQSEIKDYFDRMRRLIEHEDTLEMQRLQSLFTIQTILFGALAFTLGDKVQLNKPVFLYILAGVGIVSSLSFGTVLWLGSRAITNLLDHWEKIADLTLSGTNPRKNTAPPDVACDALGIPPIIGFHLPTSFQAWVLPSRFAPWVFGVAWVALLLLQRYIIPEAYK